MCGDVRRCWEVCGGVGRCAEVLAHKDEEVARLLQNIHWVKHQYVQLIFRVLAHNQFRICEEVTRLVRRDIAGVGDTRLIEKSHAILTDSYRQTNKQAYESVALMVELTRGEELLSRGIPCISSSEAAQWEESTSEVAGRVAWAEKFDSRKRQVPKEILCHDMEL